MNAFAKLAGVLMAAAVLTAAGLALEPVVRPEQPWPLGPLSIRGGAFRARPGSTVDLEAAADDARRALPDHEVVVMDWANPPLLVIGRAEAPTEPEPLRAWRDASGLALAGPDEVSFGRSAPDWWEKMRTGRGAVTT